MGTRAILRMDIGFYAGVVVWPLVKSLDRIHVLRAYQIILTEAQVHEKCHQAHGGVDLCILSWFVRAVPRKCMACSPADFRRSSRPPHKIPPGPNLLFGHLGCTYSAAERSHSQPLSPARKDFGAEGYELMYEGGEAPLL